MRFPSPLFKGTLLARRKRFFADVTLDDGREIVAHCPNPGAMLGVCAPGLTVWVSHNPDPKRTLAYTLEIVADPAHGGAMVGVNTMLPNKLAREGLERRAITPFAAYDRFRPEVKYGENSRIDWLLEVSGQDTARQAGRAEPSALPHGAGSRPAPEATQKCYLEIKNVHLRRGEFAEFPDCVTTRGAKHMRELANLIPQGSRAAVLFVVQRDDCAAFRPAADLDPAYARAFAEAVAAGVEAYAMGCRVSPEEITLDRMLPVTLP